MGRYCDREFLDEEILIAHQKTKHFKCETCHKRLYSVPGLAIHNMQVSALNTCRSSTSMSVIDDRR